MRIATALLGLLLILPGGLAAWPPLYIVGISAPVIGIGPKWSAALVWASAVIGGMLLGLATSMRSKISN